MGTTNHIDRCVVGRYGRSSGGTICHLRIQRKAHLVLACERRVFEVSFDDELVAVQNMIGNVVIERGTTLIRRFWVSRMYHSRLFGMPY